MSDNQYNTPISLLASFNITNEDTDESKEDIDLFKLGEQSEEEVKSQDYLQITINNDGDTEEGCNLEESLEEGEQEVSEDKTNKMTKEPERKHVPDPPLLISTEEIDTKPFDEHNIASQPEAFKSLNIKLNIPANDSKKEPVKLINRKNTNFLWISNITHQTKASDLKKLFAKIGKVTTAKILTNGENYYGYICMDSSNLATKCIKELHDTLFDGKKIIVSRDKPNLTETQTAVKRTKIKTTTKRSIKSIKSGAQPQSNLIEHFLVPKVGIKEKRKKKEAAPRSESIIANMKKELDIAKNDIGRYKYRLLQYERRHDGMRKKCDSLEREVKEMQFKMRTERRRLNQDKEQFEKIKKLEQIRLEANKETVNKELIDVKNLRERLKEKLDDLKVQARKITKKRSRSVESIRKQEPLIQSSIIGVNSRGYRVESDRKRRREEMQRGRTPPPPPKLRENRPRKNIESGKSYFGRGDEKRPLVEYEYRHKSSYLPPEDTTSLPWSVQYVKDPRRVMNPNVPSYSIDGRYGEGYQSQLPSFGAVPRNFYIPPFGKQYDHY